MIEYILAILVLSFLVLGGVVCSIVKYITGSELISCRKAHAVKMINILVNDQRKEPEVYVMQNRKSFVRKEEHAHGNV